MAQPSTFVYRVNRNGIPFEAIEYVCRHGHLSATCEVDEYCLPTGVILLEWWNNLPSQWRDREVVRSRMLNGQ
jgi:hypothetical protein